MVVRKASGKKTAQLPVCPSCHSPSLVEKLQQGKKISTCQRCGYTTALPNKKPLTHARRHAKRKRITVHKSHVHKRHQAQHSFNAFLLRFHLRMWFKIISTILLAAGLVLLPTEEFVSGILLTICGIIGLYTGLKWL